MCNMAFSPTWMRTGSGFVSGVGGCETIWCSRLDLWSVVMWISECGGTSPMQWSNGAGRCARGSRAARGVDSNLDVRDDGAAGQPAPEAPDDVSDAEIQALAERIAGMR
jgi:hypothetical protein